MTTRQPNDEQSLAEGLDDSVVATDPYTLSTAAYPSDRPQAVDDYGTTAQEERVDEPLVERVAREEPDDLAAVLDDEVVEREEEAFERMIAERAELSAEERAAGSDDPEEQARVILEDSELRALEREQHPRTAGERRTSAEATPPR